MFAFSPWTQKQNSTKRLSVLGEGKLEELARMTGELDDAEQKDSLANIDEQGLNEFLSASQSKFWFFI